MKRRTNLFYNSGNDSKFLTFSNYTECLTGSFLSTNTKLFPSKFICLKIDDLDKEEFINGLVAYYENKLAVLRDFVTKTNDVTINTLQPLSYLLRYIKEKAPNTTSTIAHIGDITEQDYNGTFSDSICVINTANLYSGTIVDNEDVENDYSVETDDKLHGWYDNEDYFGPANYANLQIITDESNLYKMQDNYIIEINDAKESAIEFNIVIPLFTMVQTDAEPDNEQTEMMQTVHDLEILTGTNYVNVPMGIWFADKMITLSGDSKYNESWSLVIGSQFKPFPTSGFIKDEITNESNSIAFGTFAQILSRQNDLFTYMVNEIKNLQKQIDELKNNNTK